jgi:hypothetical protein
MTAPLDIVSIPNGHIPFVVDMYYLNWRIFFGGSIGLCAIEFDVISNFIWFGCCKVGI